MHASKVVVFRVGNEEYGFPIEHVMSIEKFEEINVIPNMPFYMKGVVKVRGELIPVLDTNHIFYHQDTSIDEHVKLIVVQSEELTAALIVNEAKEILELQENQLKSISVGAFLATKYFMAIASIDDRLITIIHSNLFISSLEGIALIKQEVLSHQ